MEAFNKKKDEKENQVDDFYKTWKKIAQHLNDDASDTKQSSALKSV